MSHTKNTVEHLETILSIPLEKIWFDCNVNVKCTHIYFFLNGKAIRLCSLNYCIGSDIISMSCDINSLILFFLPFLNVIDFRVDFKNLFPYLLLHRHCISSHHVLLLYMNIRRDWIWPKRILRKQKEKQFYPYQNIGNRNDLQLVLIKWLNVRGFERIETNIWDRQTLF